MPQRVHFDFGSVSTGYRTVVGFVAILKTLRSFKRLNYCQLVERQPLLLAWSLIGIKLSAWSDIHRPLVCLETGDLNSEVDTELAVILKTGTANPTLAGHIYLTVAICYSEAQLYRVSWIIICETCIIKVEGRYFEAVCWTTVIPCYVARVGSE